MTNSYTSTSASQITPSSLKTLKEQAAAIQIKITTVEEQLLEELAMVDVMEGFKCCVGMQDGEMVGWMEPRTPKIRPRVFVREAVEGLEI